MVPRKPLVPLPIRLVTALALLLISAGPGVATGWAATGRQEPSASRMATAHSSTPATSAHPAAGDPGVRVTMAPAGLSFEYPTMVQDMGAGACPPSSLIGELLRLGSPPLALSGESQDLTVPSGALSGVPPSWETAVLYQLPAAFWSQLHCLLSAAKDPLTAGINAKTGQLAWAAQMVAAAQGAATNGLDFSLGNEPDLYVLPDYTSLATKLSPQEDLTAVRLYLKVAANLQQAIGKVPLLGPELAAAKDWHDQLPGVIGQLHEGMVGVHLYPFSACKDPRAATLRGLLSAAAGEAPRSLAWVAADASAAGVPAIISESNSISCGGKAGVSDAPAAAVWAVRFVLSALKTGFQEVRFHFSGSSYDPFLVRGGQVIDRPLEWGLYALNRWLPVGSTLRTAPAVRGLLATSVSGDPGGPSTIFDNEHAQAQTVSLPATHAVTVEELSAARAGLQAGALSPSGGRLTLHVAPNSVLALLP